MRWAVVFLVLTFPSVGLAAFGAGGSDSPGLVQDDLPMLLESYTFELSGWPLVELSMLDPKIEGGKAQFRFEIRPRGRGESQIRLEVFRHSDADLQLALILEEVRLQFFDAGGGLLRKIVLDENLGEGGIFLITDSNHGYFQYRTTVSGLQGARRLTVELRGNYE